MIKQTVRWLLLFLPALILAGVLAAGCSTPTGESKPSALQATTPSTTGEDSKDQQALAVKSSEAGTGSVQASQEPSVPSESSPPAQAPADQDTVTLSPSSTPGSDKIAATPQPSSVPVHKPLPTAKPAASPSTAPSSSSEKASTVTISIAGDPETGVILAPSVVEVKSGESVMDLLKRITRKNKIQMEFQGMSSFAYVVGIDNLYEHDKGAESGWMYRVNGEFPDESAGSYSVHPGDQIEWLYTLDLGKDIGDKMP